MPDATFLFWSPVAPRVAAGEPVATGVAVGDPGAAGTGVGDVTRLEPTGVTVGCAVPGLPGNAVTVGTVAGAGDTATVGLGEPPVVGVPGDVGSGVGVEIVTGEPVPDGTGVAAGDAVLLGVAVGDTVITGVAGPGAAAGADSGALAGAGAGATAEQSFDVWSEQTALQLPAAMAL